MNTAEYSAVERHESLKHLLYHQVLPRIVISQQELKLLAQAHETQDECIRKLSKCSYLLLVYTRSVFLQLVDNVSKILAL